MRIFLRILGFIMAALFVLYAIGAFVGVALPPVSMGILCLIFASDMVCNSVFYCKKPPKTEKFKNLLTFKDGTKVVFDSNLSFQETNGSHTVDDVKSVYSEATEDFDHE